MNSRLRQERNAFVFLVLVVTPVVLLSAPLPYFLSSSSSKALQRTTRDDAASVTQAFVRADRNRDGFLDAQEAAAIPGLLPLLPLLDANGDGRIERGELTRLRPARSRLVEARA